MTAVLHFVPDERRPLGPGRPVPGRLGAGQLPGAVALDHGPAPAADGGRPGWTCTSAPRSRSTRAPAPRWSASSPAWSWSRRGRAATRRSGSSGLGCRGPGRRPTATGRGSSTAGWPAALTRCGMSVRLAAYAVCMEDGRVLLARHVSPRASRNWTLPGGRVEHGEDPFDAVIREVAEETGCAAVAERLLGVDSRVIPVAEPACPACSRTRMSASSTRSASPAANCGPSRTAKPPSRSGRRSPRSLACRRSSLVDVGLALAQTVPATGHVAPVPVGGLIRH